MSAIRDNGKLGVHADRPPQALVTLPSRFPRPDPVPKPSPACCPAPVPDPVLAGVRRARARSPELGNVRILEAVRVALSTIR